jgi:hypothetical protein
VPQRFVLNEPQPLDDDLRDPACDVSRHIPLRCWDLAAVQSALSSREMRIARSPSADHDMRWELDWTAADARGFVLALGPHCYHASEWCLPANHQGKFSPMPADAYRMGYSKVDQVEAPQREPWVYFKFSIIEQQVGYVLYVLSAHDERAKR